MNIPIKRFPLVIVCVKVESTFYSGLSEIQACGASAGNDLRIFILICFGKLFNDYYVTYYLIDKCKI